MACRGSAVRVRLAPSRQTPCAAGSFFVQAARGAAIRPGSAQSSATLRQAVALSRGSTRLALRRATTEAPLGAKDDVSVWRLNGESGPWPCTAPPAARSAPETPGSSGSHQAASPIRLWTRPLAQPRQYTCIIAQEKPCRPYGCWIGSAGLDHPAGSSAARPDHAADLLRP